MDPQFSRKRNATDCAIQRSSRTPGRSSGIPTVRPSDAIENVGPRLRGCFWVWQTVFKFPFDS